MKRELSSLTEAVEGLARGEVSSEELTRDCLEQIETTEGTVKAFLTVCAEEAIEAAKASDRRRREGHALSVIDGIPYAVKDSFCTKGIRTTAASRMLEQYIPPYDATVVSLLRDAGCVLLGKTNLDEFAMGSDGSHSAFGTTRNPLDPSRVAGGSSGGSAAAVASGEVFFALGSDTGGSVRQPAAFCGITGVKPTYGAISRYGMIAFASSLDCVGLLTKNAEDAALLLPLLAQRDARDATSVGLQASLDRALLSQGAKGLRVGIPTEAWMREIGGSIGSSVQMAADRLAAAGATVVEASLPSAEQTLMSYCIISAVEAASNLARYDGFRYGASFFGATPDERSSTTRGAAFGNEVKSRILLGTALLTGELRETQYLPACRMREQVCHSMQALFARFDLILQPTTPCGAFRADEDVSPLRMRQMDLCTVYASLAGLPAISVPMGKDENGMPLGVQLTATYGREDLILRGARALEL